MSEIVLPGGNKLEFILAVPGRRYGDFVELLEPFHTEQCLPAKEEILGEAAWNKLRLIIAHDPQVSLDTGAKRDKRIDALKALARQWVGKLNDQDAGKTKPGKKLSDGGARAKFYREVSVAHLARIVKVDLKSELFTYSIDERALKHAKMIDGKLLLVTNAPDSHPRRWSSATSHLRTLSVGLGCSSQRSRLARFITAYLTGFTPTRRFVLWR